MLQEYGSGMAHDSKQSRSATPASPCKSLAYQLGMFSLCYFAWVCVHMQREYWAMSKEEILKKNPDLHTTFFGWINMSLFLPYALC